MFWPRIAASIALLAILLLLGLDAAFHMKPELIQLKRQHKSAQRHWNLFYDQSYVFNDSSMKYQLDFEHLDSVFNQNAVLLADISTSYYLVAELPVFVKNVHRHHGRAKSGPWGRLLKEKHACYLDQPNRKLAFKKFLLDEQREAVKKHTQALSYLIVNKDQINLNMRNDCLSQRRTAFIQNIGDMADLVFDGDYMMVYKIKNQR